MKTRLAPITHTLLLGTLVLASASALATQPTPQQATQKKASAEKTVARQAEAAAAANAVAADMNAAAAGNDMAAADREANRAVKDARMAKHAKVAHVRHADRRKEAANAMAADLNATAAGVRMAAATREADRAAGDMLLAAEAKQGYVQTAQTAFTTPDGQQVTVRSIIPIAGKN
ncbi:hypothetical protein [Thermomonas haemolytica]|uniref:Colicin import membrane protein n=1 Tax=Thermomonas haemolytica TaxID=141949 RepID=A0A4R3NAM1_9GAMM|nr:hypothetical protein [Thermomonas haemolytica]TCT25844.1 hypothetical protein EDC34_101170 [Thermomonas haemolytica]